MTSSTDANRHPDVSEISDLTEGLLTPSQSADVRRHLSECELCADVHTSLEEIRGLLGTLPGPSRMPSDVAGRIDAALAAEALLSATAPRGSDDVSRETPTGSTASDRIGATPDRPAGHPRAASGPGRSRPRRRRRAVVLSAVLGVAAVGVSVLLTQSLSTTTSGESGTASDASTGRTAEDFAGAPVQERVDSLLAAGVTSAEPRIEKMPSAEAEAVSPRSSPGDTLPECVQRGTGRAEQPIAFERGDYAGEDAYLVVLPDRGDDTRVTAYVVDADCVGSSDTPTGSLLLTRTYPRQ